MNNNVRQLRGGSYGSQPLLGLDEMNSIWRNNNVSGDPASFNFSRGFRIAAVPEPASLALLILGGAVLLSKRAFGR